MTSIAALAVGIAVQADAQALPRAPASRQPQQEVLVTAQRRPQRNKDVPVSVSRLNSEAIQTIQTAGGDIRSLAARVPSLNIESSFGRTFPRLHIRGLGNPDFDVIAAQPVGVYYDDVVLQNPLLKSPIFNIDDVELLAGPQGTLFGRNTPAGIPKISSRRPADDFEGFFDQSYATYNKVSSTAVVNAPVIPGQLDVRISIINQHREDWVTNDYTGDYRWRQNLDGFDDLAGRSQAMYILTTASTSCSRPTRVTWKTPRRCSAPTSCRKAATIWCRVSIRRRWRSTATTTRTSTPAAAT